MPTRQWGPEDTATIAWALLVLAGMMAVAALILSKFRGVADERGDEAGEPLIKFREMHSRGELTDEEFRTIKAKLTEAAQRELKDSEKPG